MNPFLAETVLRRFKSAQYRDLMDTVESIDERTELVPVSSPEDVHLQDNGLTVRGGYRLTPLAFRQLCQGLANGLTAVVADLSGFRRKAGADDEAVSIPAAVRVYNLCVDLRCFMLGGPGGKQLICNSRDGVIDGALGVGYRYLPHAALLEAAEQSYSSANMIAAFSSGKLYGRRLEAVWRTESPLFQTPSGESVYGGYQIVNSEAGECGVRASAMLIFGSNDVRCLKPGPSKKSLAHAGKKFTRKLAMLLGKSMAEGDELIDAQDRMLELSRRPLQVVDRDGKPSDARRRMLVRILAGAGLPLSVAQEIVRYAIWAGSGDSIDTNLFSESLRKRTALDLFWQLSRRAHRYPDFVRWQIEEVAYEVLSGKLLF